MTSKVSFTIRPPTASSRPIIYPTDSSRVSTPNQTSFTPHAADSSDEDEEDGAIEAVTAFDQSGAQRLHKKARPSGPLVIPALANRDWRAIARRRKQQSFIPDGAAAPTGKDGSQGGLGTRDSINSSPQATGLVVRSKQTIVKTEDASIHIESQEALVETTEKVEESEDERARRALLASVTGGDDDKSTIIDAIPLSSNDYAPPRDETDAYKQDVVTRPDSATLADYERVPVSQFGAALLRGMGWKEGTAASRTRKGLVEPWLPTSRPALLGIGAKERPAEDIPSSGKGGFVSKRPERRYIPVVKLQREGSELPPSSRSRSRSCSPSRSRPLSRVPSSASASPYLTPDDREYDRRRHRDRDDGLHYKGSGHASQRDRDSTRDSDRVRRKERGDKSYDRDRKRESGRPSEKDFRWDERERSSRGRGDRG